MNGWYRLMLHNFLNLLKQAKNGLSEPQQGTSSSLPRSRLGFTWESPSPALVAAISDCFIAQVGWPQAKHRWGADLGLHHLVNPWACTSIGQLQTMLEHHHPAPAKLILHGGWRLVVSGHSQSLQLSGPGKYLPLICQQQPRLNYNRRVYSVHTKGTP